MKPASERSESTHRDDEGLAETNGLDVGGDGENEHGCKEGNKGSAVYSNGQWDGLSEEDKEVEIGSERYNRPLL